MNKSKSYRNRTCFVPNCTSGYRSNKEKVSLFKAPNDKYFRNLWTSKIPRLDRELQSHDVVCEKHFKEQHIIRFRMIGNMKINYDYPKLKNGAVPTIFPKKTSTESNDTHPAKRRKVERVCEIETETPLIFTLDSFETAFTSLYSTLPSASNITSTETTALKPSTSSAPSFLENPIEEISKELIFEDISAQNLNLNRWVYNINEDEKEKEAFIVLTKIKMIKNYPVLYKSIVIKKKLSARVFFLKKEIHSTILQSLNDINELICYADNKEVCIGGPKIEQFSAESWNSSMSVVDSDFSRWKHKRCSFVANIGYFL